MADWITILCQNRCTPENFSQDLDKDITHRYGATFFKLYRLPIPLPGEVLGLVGPHNIGKTSALKVLAGELQPNLGRSKNPPDWPEILTHFHDPELNSYLTKIVDKKLKVVFKPQYVQDYLRGRQMLRVREMLESFNQRDMMKEICDALELNKFMDLSLHHLSTGEQHRVTLAAVVLQKADVYIFDEISNFLDVSQRFKAAQLIRSLITLGSYVIVVENDLSVLDYVSDYIHYLFGEPGAYGVFAQSDWDVRAGIEYFVHGYDPLEKKRIRGEPLIFEAVRTVKYEHIEKDFTIFIRHSYPCMSVTHRDFKLEVTGGKFTDGQILVVLGERCGEEHFHPNAGRAGLHPPDEVEGVKTWSPKFRPSYKPQRTDLGSECTVRQLLEREKPISYIHRKFVSDVIKPLQIDRLLDRKVASLSPAETQKVALTLCLIKDANVFLIDEPSTYLDPDERIEVVMAIQRHVLRVRRAAVIVEHDFLMAAYLADQVILVEETPSSTKFATSTCTPYPRLRGLNLFLAKLNITFCRDPETFRFTPRANKLGSIEDKEQKAAGNYYGLT